MSSYHLPYLLFHTGQQNILHAFVQFACFLLVLCARGFGNAEVETSSDPAEAFHRFNSVVMRVSSGFPLGIAVPTLAFPTWSRRRPYLCLVSPTVQLPYDLLLVLLFFLSLSLLKCVTLGGFSDVVSVMVTVNRVSNTWRVEKRKTAPGHVPSKTSRYKLCPSTKVSAF